MPTSVKARFEQSLPRAQLASFLGVSTQLHTGPALTSDMVDIYAIQIALEERMRETGRQQEATQFKSKQKVRIYNFRETVGEFEDSHTAVALDYSCAYENTTSSTPGQ